MDDTPQRPVLTGLLSDPWRLVRFGLVGGMSTVIYAVFAWIFTVVLTMPAVVGSILAYCLAAVFSYNAHRRVTFRSDRPVAEEAPRFAGISFAGWIVAIISPLILTNGWGLPPIVAIVFASVAVPIMSFIGLERFVFRPRPEIGRPPADQASDGGLSNDGPGDGRPGQTGAAGEHPDRVSDGGVISQQDQRTID